MIRPILAATALLALGIASAEAGLNRWSLGFLDRNGKATTYDRAAYKEVWMEEAGGWQFSLTCTANGPMIAVAAGRGQKADFAGPFIEPGIRVTVPGRDLWAGVAGRLTFDGKAYVGAAPPQIVDAMLKGTRVHVIEYLTHTEIKWPLQGSERYFAELSCLNT